MRTSRMKALCALSIIFVLFQNFTLVGTDKKALFPQINLDKANHPQNTNDDALAVIQEMNQYNLNKETIVAPDGGRDLQSVAANWAQRQGTVWLNGADKRLLASLNESLQSTLDTWTTEPETTDKRVPASAKTTSNQIESTSVLRSLRFTRVNALEYGMQKNGKLTMRMEGDGGHLDYSHDLNKKTKLGVEHKSANNNTQFLLRYDW